MISNRVRKKLQKILLVVSTEEDALPRIEKIRPIRRLRRLTQIIPATLLLFMWWLVVV